MKRRGSSSHSVHFLQSALCIGLKLVPGPGYESIQMCCWRKLSGVGRICKKMWNGLAAETGGAGGVCIRRAAAQPRAAGGIKGPILAQTL